MALIESVPNVSEGRRPEVVDALVARVRGSGEVRVLDVSSDAAHNRSVLTLAGSAASIEAAAAALFDAALAVIDLGAHRGEHPRIGAVDVVPFVPLAEATMADCVELARRVGREVAARFAIPVFLYEEAATSPARRALAAIRRGGLAGLAARMAEPAWRPDFGPSRPHPRAGVTVIGARGPLIAYNINLATTRRDVARAIAGAIRERDGGLQGVRAIPITLADGTAQVSMNLTDFTATSPMQAFEAVERAAAMHGVAIRESELVGLIPEAALADADLARLRIRGFDGSQVLEKRLRSKK